MGADFMCITLLVRAAAWLTTEVHRSQTRSTLAVKRSRCIEELSKIVLSPQNPLFYMSLFVYSAIGRKTIRPVRATVTFQFVHGKHERMQPIFHDDRGSWILHVREFIQERCIQHDKIILVNNVLVPFSTGAPRKISIEVHGFSLLDSK